MPIEPEIDVVVVTWEGRDLLDSCLRHLAQQTISHRVIVVDNGSTDGTAAMVAMAHPFAELVALPDNLGYGAGNNRGVSKGRAPYLVLVNNDVDVKPDFLDQIVAPLRDNDLVGAVAGLTTRPGDGRVDQFGIGLDAGLCAHTRGAGRDPDEPVPGVLAAPCGAVAAYRRAAFEQVGGFDSALFAYSEDLDIALRMQSAGWTLAEAPNARGVHLGSATTGLGSPWQRRLTSFGRGFVLGRYRHPQLRGVLHGLAVDAAVVLYGLARHRTAVPLTERWRGYRAGRRGGRRAVPLAAIDPGIGLVTALRRLTGGS